MLTRARRLWSSEYSRMFLGMGTVANMMCTAASSLEILGRYVGIAIDICNTGHTNLQSQEKKSTDSPQHSPITDQQIPTAPSSHTTDYRSFSIIADDGKL